MTRDPFGPRGSNEERDHMKGWRTTHRVGLIALGVLFVLVFVIGPPATAQGVSPARLTRAGWDCFVPKEGDVVHCAPPGGLARVLSGEAGTMNFLVFGTTDPTATQAPFRGTEHIVRADLFNGQPCPQDPPSMEYTYLKPILGLDYYACHHYDSAF